MKMSDSIDALVKEMSVFRRNVKQPMKDAKNPFFRSNYVPLEGVQQAIEDALPKSIWYTQEVTSADGEVQVSTVIFHESGQFIKYDPLTLPLGAKPKKGEDVNAAKMFTAQDVGSAQTYGRRYALSAVFGITSDQDDDGNAVSGHSTNQQGSQPRRQSNQRSTPASKGQTAQRQSAGPTNQRSQQGQSQSVSAKVNTINTLIEEIANISGKDVVTLLNWYAKKLLVGKFNELTDSRADQAIAMLNDHLTKAKQEAASAPK